MLVSALDMPKLILQFSTKFCCFHKWKQLIFVKPNGLLPQNNEYMKYAKQQKPYCVLQCCVFNIDIYLAVRNYSGNKQLV